MIMSNKNFKFKTMTDSDKIKLINNSLVLEGLSLKELSKKLNIQKKDIIRFMNSKNLFFDDIDCYFKKTEEVTYTSNNKPNLQKDSISAKKNTQREDVQAIIDSINEKLNLKELESNTTLLPEIKTIEEPINSDENENINTSHSCEILTLEIPKISRTARRKRMKKNFFKRFISYIKDSISKFFLIKKKDKLEEHITNTTYNPCNTNKLNKSDLNKFMINDNDKSIFEEVAIESLSLDINTENENHKINNNKLSFEIKIPKNIKGIKRFPFEKENIYQIDFLNLDKYYLDDLKNELRSLKLQSNFISNLDETKLDIDKNKSLEERVNNLEKKISELENFFLEIFQAMSTK